MASRLDLDAHAIRLTVLIELWGNGRGERYRIVTEDVARRGLRFGEGVRHGITRICCKAIEGDRLDAIGTLDTEHDLVGHAGCSGVLVERVGQTVSGLRERDWIATDSDLELGTSQLRGNVVERDLLHRAGRR